MDQKELSVSRTAGRRPNIATVLTIPLLLILFLLAACGDGDGSNASPGDEFNRVTANGKTYSLEDLEAMDYRESKSYDVNGLVGATAAYYGFWRPGSGASPVDFEVRMYPSHATAVESGTPQAEEVTGDNAVLDRNASSWPEGLTDRRRVVGPGASQGTGQPRYQDYIIFGNLVVLCEGLNLDDAQDNCREFVAALP